MAVQVYFGAAGMTITAQLISYCHCQTYYNYVQLNPAKCIDLFYKDQYDVKLNLYIVKIDKEEKNSGVQPDGSNKLVSILKNSFLPFFIQIMENVRFSALP